MLQQKIEKPREELNKYELIRCAMIREIIDEMQEESFFPFAGGGGQDFDAADEGAQELKEVAEAILKTEYTLARDDFGLDLHEKMKNWGLSESLTKQDLENTEKFLVELLVCIRAKNRLDAELTRFKK
jgi:hypothetical protein